MFRVTSLFLTAIVFLPLPLTASFAESEKPAMAPTPETALVERVTVKKQRVLDGVIEAVNQATVSAQTSGRIEKIFFDVNDAVKKGDLLIQFRDRDQRAAFDAAQAAFREAEAEYQRVQGIYEKKLVAKAVLDRAEARFRATRAQRDQASENLENTRVRAPYSGIVVKRHIQQGELARPGQPLMTGLSLEELRANVDLPQSMIHRVQELRQASLLTQKGPVEAQSITISPYADPVSHTFLVRVNLPQGDYGVYPGMLVKVAFVHGEESRLTVPRQAVAQRGEVSAVYVRSAEGKLSYRQVRVGAIVATNQAVEILAGVDEGETLMLDPVKAASLLKQQEP